MIECLLAGVREPILDTVAEITGRRGMRSLEDLWFILDWIDILARGNGFILSARVSDPEDAVIPGGSAMLTE